MRRLDHWVGGALEKVPELLLFLAGLVTLAAPGLLVRAVLQWTESALPTALHAVVMLAFFAIVGFWSRIIIGDKDFRTFRRLKQRIRWQHLLSSLLVLYAIPCFASLTLTLNDHHLVKFDPAPPRNDFSGVESFYAWYFVDSIPGLKVPETLMWERPPYKYNDSLSGVLLLCFKLAVVIPVIGSFTASNRVGKEAKEKSQDRAGKAAAP